MRSLVKSLQYSQETLKSNLESYHLVKLLVVLLQLALRDHLPTFAAGHGVARALGLVKAVLGGINALFADWAEFRG